MQLISLTVHASIEFDSHADIRIPGHRINPEVSTIERTGKLVLNHNISVIVSFEHLKYNFMGINEAEAAFVTGAWKKWTQERTSA